MALFSRAAEVWQNNSLLSGWKQTHLIAFFSNKVLPWSPLKAEHSEAELSFVIADSKFISPVFLVFGNIRLGCSCFCLVLFMPPFFPLCRWFLISKLIKPVCSAAPGGKKEQGHVISTQHWLAISDILIIWSICTNAAVIHTLCRKQY